MEFLFGELPWFTPRLENQRMRIVIGTLVLGKQMPFYDDPPEAKPGVSVSCRKCQALKMTKMGYLGAFLEIYWEV